MRATGHILGFIPSYQAGTVALIGWFLVAMWMLSRFLSEGTNRLLFPSRRETTSAFGWFPVRKVWIIIGSFILLTLAIAMNSWRQFTFMQGVQSIGRSRLAAYLTSLRSWLTQFIVSFIFAEMSRILSIMTQLAAFGLFLAAKIGYLPFLFDLVVRPDQGIVAVQPNWTFTLGSIINQNAFISYPFLLYDPLIFIILTVLGMNFITRGIRGGSL